MLSTVSRLSNMQIEQTAIVGRRILQQKSVAVTLLNRLNASWTLFYSEQTVGYIIIEKETYPLTRKWSGCKLHPKLWKFLSLQARTWQGTATSHLTSIPAGRCCQRCDNREDVYSIEVSHNLNLNLET